MYSYRNPYRSIEVFGIFRSSEKLCFGVTDTDFIANDQCLFIVWTLRENRMVNLWMGKLTGYKYWGHGGNLPFVSIQESTEQVPKISIIPIWVLVQNFAVVHRLHWRWRAASTPTKKTAFWCQKHLPNISIIPIRVLLEQFLCCSQVHWCPASKQHSDQAHSLLLRVPKNSIILRPSKQVCKILSSSSPFPIWDQQSLYEFL